MLLKFINAMDSNANIVALMVQIHLKYGLHYLGITFYQKVILNEIIRNSL